MPDVDDTIGRIAFERARAEELGRPRHDPRAMDQPQRRRLGGASTGSTGPSGIVGGMAEFVGGKGAVDEVPVEPTPVTGQAIDDDLDPSGRPYRAATDTRPGDPKIGQGIGRGWGRIVRTVFRIDEEAAFERLSSVSFERKPSRLEYGELVDALDECSTLVVLASQLHENAKVVQRLYEADIEVLRAPMRARAKAELMAEKKASADAKAGAGKAIHEPDIVAKIVELWPDEYRRQEENLAKAKGMVSHVGALSERWAQRAREIDGLVRTSRKV